LVALEILKDNPTTLQHVEIRFAEFVATLLFIAIFTNGWKPEAYVPLKVAVGINIPEYE
jgi:hypothetical protein